MLRRFICYTSAVLCVLQLSACVPVLFGTVAAGGGAILTDRRSAAVQTMDRALQIETERDLHKQFGKKINLEVTVFNRKILLTGMVPSAERKQEVEDLVKQTQSPRAIFNEIIVGDFSTSSKVSDATITSSVKTALLATRGIPSNSIRVTTAAGVVYLMGLVTDPEAQAAAHVASKILGVQRVVKLFEYISIEERDRLDRTTPVTDEKK
jgi:osmotically-inducible protein OsmY